MTPRRLPFEALPWQRLLGRGAGWQRTLAGAVLLASAVVLALAAWQAVQAQRQRATLLNDWAQRSKVRPPAPLSAPRAATQAPSAEALRQLDMATARLNMPWPVLFNAVERRTVRGVALLALEPDARAGLVQLTAEARTLDELLAYAEALGRDRAFSSVRLGQHEQRGQEPGQPVRMTLVAVPAQR